MAERAPRILFVSVFWFKQILQKAFAPSATAKSPRGKMS